MTAYNACSEYVRQKYPERHRLSNRLRYMLTHQKSFDLWQGDSNQWLCGLKVWRNAATARCPEGSLQDCSQPLGAMGGPNSQGGDLAFALSEIFKCVGRPCLFEELVNTLADLWGLNAASQAEVSYEDDEANAGQQPDTSLVIRIELRAYLRRLWTEICELPLQQRWPCCSTSETPTIRTS